MSTSTKGTFDIRNYIDKLEILADEASQMVCGCLVCGGSRLTINKGSGAYQCWSGGCAAREIRESVAPWADREPQQRGASNPKKDPKGNPPAPMPDAEQMILAMLMGPPTDIPETETHLDCEVLEISKTIYRYGPGKQVVRSEWADPSNPKGHSKEVFPYHIDVSTGKFRKGKGKLVWPSYREDEALEHGSGKWIVLLEGETCVEVCRWLQMVGVTFQGSDWGTTTLIDRLLKLKTAGVAGILIFPDHDAAGKIKADKVRLSAATVGFPTLLINPIDLWDGMPEKGDIVDWVNWGTEQGMDPSEFIRRLEEQFQALGEQARIDEEEVRIPDFASSAVTVKEAFCQIVYEALYRSWPWICFKGGLYCWSECGTYYEESMDLLERRRIAEFCDTYAVFHEMPNGGGYYKYDFANPESVERALKWVKVKLAIKPELANPPGVNCTNGVLQLYWEGVKPVWELVKHDPKMYYIYKPLVRYDPEANPEHCDRLLEALDAPQRKIFLQIAGASLDVLTVRQFKGRLIRASLMKGGGNNGKDSLREVLSAIYGYRGVTNATINDFASYDNGRKFTLSQLGISRINWSSENANFGQLDKIQSLKAFVTGDPLDIERKGQDHFPFTPSAVCFFNVNDTPQLTAFQEAIRSRYAVFSFNKTFKIGADTSKGELEADPRFKYDPQFIRKEVLPAFLNKMLAGLEDLMVNGIDYHCTDQALEDIQAENSHLFQFCLDTGLTYKPEAKTYVGDIWEKLEPWYVDSGALSYEEINGKKKTIWMPFSDKKGDELVKASHQVLKRFQPLFPKAKRGSDRNKVFLSGIAFSSKPPDDYPGNPPPDDYPGNPPSDEPTLLASCEPNVRLSVSLEPLLGMDCESSESTPTEINAVVIGNDSPQISSTTTHQTRLEFGGDLPELDLEISDAVLILNDVADQLSSWEQLHDLTEHLTEEKKREVFIRLSLKVQYKFKDLKRNHEAALVNAESMATIERLNPKAPEYNEQCQAIADAPIIALDIETYQLDVSGKGAKKEALHPWRGLIRLISLCIGERTFIIDFGGREDLVESQQPNIDLLRMIVQNPGQTIVGHNLIFDLRFLATRLEINNAKNVACTMIGARVFYGDYGADGDKKSKSEPIYLGGYGLENLAKRLVGIAMDKQNQKSDWGASLSDEQIVYAAKDAQATLAVYFKLEEQYANEAHALYSEPLRKGWQLECDVIPAAIEVELAGMPLDAEAAQAQINVIEQHRQRLLSEWKLLCPDLNPTQDVKLCQFLKENYDLDLPGLSKDVLDANARNNPLIKLRMQLQGLRSLANNLDGFLSSAARDGRIHTIYNTLTGTGRFSSGGKADDLPNLQSIGVKENPLLSEFRLKSVREVIRPNKGRKMAVIDLAGAHGRIAADQTNDETAIAGNNDSSIDNHSKVAVFIAKAQGFDWQWEYIAQARKDKAHPDYAKAVSFRNVAKNTYYGWLNGAGAATIQDQIAGQTGQRPSIEECKAAIEGCKALYPGVLKHRHELMKRLKETAVDVGGRLVTINSTSDGFRLCMPLVSSQYSGALEPPYTQSIACIWSRIEATAIKKALIRIMEVREKHPEWELLVLNVVHDEIDIEVNSDYASIAVPMVNDLIGDCFAAQMTKVRDGRETDWTKLVVDSWADK